MAALCEIHRGWFRTTFPSDAGQIRLVDVVNRKGTAAGVHQSIHDLTHQALGNYYHRLELINSDSLSADERMVAIIDLINTCVVSIYAIHPFRDGNTRATFSLRNYLLEVEGYGRLTDQLENKERFLEAWWQATPDDHRPLDDALLRELIAIRRRKLGK